MASAFFCVQKFLWNFVYYCYSSTWTTFYLWNFLGLFFLILNALHASGFYSYSFFLTTQCSLSTWYYSKTWHESFKYIDLEPLIYWKHSYIAIPLCPTIFLVDHWTSPLICFSGNSIPVGLREFCLVFPTSILLVFHFSQ